MTSSGGWSKHDADVDAAQRARITALESELSALREERDAAWRERDAFVESHDHMRDSLDAATERLALVEADAEALAGYVKYSVVFTHLGQGHTLGCECPADLCVQRARVLANHAALGITSQAG